MRRVDSKPIRYEIKVRTILENRDSIIEVWSEVTRDDSAPYYIGRFPTVAGGPPWYPAVIQVADVEDGKFYGKLIGTFNKRGSKPKLVEIKFLLDPCKIQIPKYWRRFPALKPPTEEEDMNRKLDEFTDKIINMLYYGKTLTSEKLKDACYECFVSPEEIERLF